MADMKDVAVRLVPIAVGAAILFAVEPSATAAWTAAGVVWVATLSVLALAGSAVPIRAVGREALIVVPMLAAVMLSGVWFEGEVDWTFAGRLAFLLTLASAGAWIVRALSRDRRRSVG